MKKLFLFSFVLFAGHCSFAQDTSGTIVFEEVVNMSADLQNVPQELAGLIPSEHKSRHLLHYTTDASLYESDAANAENPEKSLSSGGMQIRIRTQVPEDKVYASYADRRVVQQREFMSRKFLIRSGYTTNWKMTGRQKKILGYACMEAVGISGKDTVTAWYTPSIPLSTGPEGLAGLPGMILEAARGRNHTVKALSLKPGQPSGTIKEPKSGKEVTEEQYRAIQEQKMKEMQAEHGGRGGVIIKTDRH